MDKILEKFGIYDLVAILVLQLFYKFSININFRVNETVVFFVISYFLGLVFQEFGSFIQKKTTHKNNALLKAALKTSDNSHIYLTDKEKKGVYSYIIEKLNLNPHDNIDNIVYNYCKFYILESNETTRIDKDQSISAMSRSLSLYFALLAVMVFISNFFEPAAMKIILVIISLFFAGLFYYRCMRFTKLRYINIFRTFYYKVVAK